ncbi:MAG: AAA family ATPase [Bacteroidia bacterium]|nr:AAA family ATPase [Bacteroidia bacterium]
MTTETKISETINSRIVVIHDPETGAPLVKKILNNEFPSHQRVKQFYNEYEITCNLQVRGIRKAVSKLKEDRTPVILLDYVEGVTLHELAKDGAMPLDRFFPIAISLAETLAELHRTNVIHKDLSSLNVIIKKDDDSPVIIDFGIASRIDLRPSNLGNPEKLEGNLKYISPEQTGRMNRMVDYRADFYSLGVTFFHVLTGQLPFEGMDPIELVHAHIALTPDLITDRNPNLPEGLARIIAKLLEKDADNRYQSAQGLQKDLERAWKELEKTGTIAPFPLGSEDFSSRFQIPNKLYGRENEVKILLDAFSRAAEGGMELMLVGGYSGTGKTALINETHKPITEKRGYFIHGKFDQFQRNIPYFAIIQAFEEFVKLLLTENEETLALWAQKIRNSVGTEGKVLTDVIPTLNLIIGEQPPIPELAGKEAQNRFNYVFRNFIREISQQDHPIVLFIDDLQWADSGSLELLKTMVTDKDNHYLLCICAYRDNEVSPTHPFIRAVDEMEQEKALINRIQVNNLSLKNVNELISDSLNVQKSKASPLTELIYEKTQGNAFFLRQFLRNLYEEQHLVFDFGKLSWTWDTEKIRQLNITDNVVELMAAKIKRLSPELQGILKVASCIGSRFDLKTVSLAIGKNPEETNPLLEEAMVEGMIMPAGEEDHFSFVHDRIQQAASSLLPEQEKVRLHVRIGKLLLGNIPVDQQEDRLFDIVNQLNWGVEIMTDPHERENLARLNLSAGIKAKGSAAYIPGYNYLTKGIQLLQNDPWKNQYDLSLPLYTQAAETAYMSARFEQMDEAIDTIFAHATNLLDKVPAYRTRILSFKARNQLLESINTGLEVLEQLGIKFPAQPTPKDTETELVATLTLLADKSKEYLLNLPEMTDQSKIAALTFLSDINSSVYWARAELFPFIVFKTVELSVKHGNTPISSFAYGTFGVILSGVVGDMRRAYEFGELGIEVMNKFKAKEWLAQVYTPQYALIVHWNEHTRKTMKPLVESVHIGLETGAIEYAMINANIYCIHGYLIGSKLKGLEEEIGSYSALMKTFKQETNYNFNQIYHQAVLNLMGKSPDPCRLVGSAYNEQEMLPKHLEANDLTASFFVYFNKLILNYLFGNYKAALEYRDLTEARLAAVLAKLENTAFNFYDSLLCLALLPESSEEKRAEYLEKVQKNQEVLKKWAADAPMNYLHKYYLVEAEKARSEGNAELAHKFYDQAITGAMENDYLNEEALAYELAGRYFLEQGNTPMADKYLQSAYKVYQNWEATAKVWDLAARYPGNISTARRSTGALIKESQDITNSSTTTTESALFDLVSVLKASSVISEELVLSRLLDKLLRIVIENAGAQKGFLLLREGSKLFIQAECRIDTDEVTVLQHIPLEESASLPHQVVTYVMRSRQAVVIDNASEDPTFGQDPYIKTHMIRSIHCAPIINQGNLTGIIYLENNQLSRAFTEDRVGLLNLLSGQIAISIHNALLYENLEQKVKERTFEIERQKEEIEEEKEKSDKLLLNILPQKTADELKKFGEAKPRSYDSVTVLFSDIVSFTHLSSRLSPAELVQELNTYFGGIDEIVARHGLEKIKTIGDAYMCAGGLPDPDPESPVKMVRAAREMLDFVAKKKAERIQKGESYFDIRIGINTGPVIAGVVGTRKFAYDIWGDSVNIASRMESSGSPNKINISGVTHALVKDQFNCTYRGKVAAKNIGEVDMYFVD